MKNTSQELSKRHTESAMEYFFWRAVYYIDRDDPSWDKRRNAWHAFRSIVGLPYTDVRGEEYHNR